MLLQLLKAVLKKAETQYQPTGILREKLPSVECEVHPFISVGVEFELQFIFTVLGVYEKYLANFLLHLPFGLCWDLKAAEH